MIGNSVQPNSAKQVLYVDYEVSGCHSPILDLAKPFYNDVFFSALYADCIPDPPRVDVSYTGTKLTLSFKSAGRGLSRAVRFLRSNDSV